MNDITAQEKAKQLVDKFLPEVRGADRYNYNLESMNVFIAKQCALICVDEILKSKPTQPTKDGFESNEFPIWFDVIEATEFYEQVKTEIEKL